MLLDALSRRRQLARLTVVAASRRLPPARQIAYGDHPDQVGNLHLPAGDRVTGRGRRSS